MRISGVVSGILGACLAAAFISIEWSWLHRSALAGPLLLLGAAVAVIGLGLAMTAVNRD